MPAWATVYILAAVAMTLSLLCHPLVRARAGWAAPLLGAAWPLAMVGAAVYLVYQLVAQAADDVQLPPPGDRTWGRRL